VRTLVAVFTLLLASCCSHSSPQLLTPDPPNSVAATVLAWPLAADENVRAREVRSGANSSISIVQIRDREQPHVHGRYDLTVTLVRGSGTLWLDGAPLAMHAGDMAFIPKGTPHYFVNGGPDPAAALVVFAPPFSGPDQQPIP
jgi:mannose-6-phosphate isomerase-like protein (cupin superfamily)